jgi:hypothetical protein
MTSDVPIFKAFSDFDIDEIPAGRTFRDGCSGDSRTLTIRQLPAARLSPSRMQPWRPAASRTQWASSKKRLIIEEATGASEIIDLPSAIRHPPSAEDAPLDGVGLCAHRVVFVY